MDKLILSEGRNGAARAGGQLKQASGEVESLAGSRAAWGERSGAEPVRAETMTKSMFTVPGTKCLLTGAGFSTSCYDKRAMPFLKPFPGSTYQLISRNNCTPLLK